VGVCIPFGGRTQYSSLRRPSREDSSDTLIVRVLIVLTSVLPFLASHYCTRASTMAQNISGVDETSQNDRFVCEVSSRSGSIILPSHLISANWSCKGFPAKTRRVSTTYPSTVRFQQRTGLSVHLGRNRAPEHVDK
jgi:hypothetical protein